MAREFLPVLKYTCKRVPAFIACLSFILYYLPPPALCIAPPGQRCHLQWLGLSTGRPRARGGRVASGVTAAKAPTQSQCPPAAVCVEHSDTDRGDGKPVTLCRQTGCRKPCGLSWEEGEHLRNTACVTARLTSARRLSHNNAEVEEQLC